MNNQKFEKIIRLLSLFVILLAGIYLSSKGDFWGGGLVLIATIKLADNK